MPRDDVADLVAAELQADLLVRRNRIVQHRLVEGVKMTVDPSGLMEEMWGAGMSLAQDVASYEERAEALLALAGTLIHASAAYTALAMLNDRQEG